MRRAEELKRVTIGLTSTSKENASRLSMVDKRVTLLDAIWPVSVSSTRIFSGLIALMNNKNKVTITPGTYFLLRLERLQGEIQTPQGAATIYAINQGLHVSDIWVSTNKMEFLYIPEQKNEGERIHFGEMLFPVSHHQEWLNLKQYCIWIKNGGIFNIDTTIAGQQLELADKWLPQLKQHYLPDIPAPGEEVTS